MPTQCNRVIQLYKKSASQYFSFARKSLTWRAIERPALLRFLQTHTTRETCFIDIGCGFGRSASIVAQHTGRPENILGIDSDRFLLSQARKRIPKATWILNDIRMNFRSHIRADAALATMVFEHFNSKDLDSVLKNIFVHLEPGAYFFCIIAHPKRIGRANGKHYSISGWRDIKTPWNSHMPIFHRPVEAYLKAFSRTGFRIETTRDLYMPKSFKQKRYADSAPVRLALTAQRLKG